MISICIKDNNSKLLDYLITEIRKSTISDIYYSKHSFKIYDNIIIHYKGNNKEKFYDFVSQIIEQSILIFYEPTLLKKLISLNYFYFDDSDKKVILQEYKILKSKNNKEYKEKINKLVELPFKKYIMSNKSVILEGFVNFRLEAFISYLDNLIEQSVSQFILDKEYIEFVDLLKNYVESKIPESTIVNLVYVNSEGLLLTNDWKYIELENFNSHYLSDITFSNNDYILNTLVGLLPQQIVLHLISPEDQFIKTIKLIFDGKVTTCTGCELCKAYKLLKLN